jgi:hypothetical protein
MKRTIILCSLAFLFSMNAMTQTINGTYAIQNVKTGKIFVPMKQEGSAIVLLTKTSSDLQLWKLVKQNPSI